MRDRARYASQRESGHLSTSLHQCWLRAAPGWGLGLLTSCTLGILLASPWSQPWLLLGGTDPLSPWPAACMNTRGLQQPERALRQSPKDWQLESQPVFREMANAKGLWWGRIQGLLHQQKSHGISKVLTGPCLSLDYH